MEWAAEQPTSAHSKGYSEGVMSVVEVTYEELLTDEEAAELKEKAKE